MQKIDSFLKSRTFFKDKLLKGTTIILLGMLSGSLFNYLYHLVSGRLLEPGQYGLLESLIVLTYFLGVFSGAFSYSAVNLMAKKKKEEVWQTTLYLEKMALRLAVFFAAIFAIAYPLLKRLLHLPESEIFLIFIFQIPAFFLLAAYQPTLQARLKFVDFSLVGVAQPVFKIVLLVILLLLLPREAQSALLAITLSGWLIIFLSRFLVKRRWCHLADSNRCRSLGNRFWSYSALSLLTNLALVSLYNTDLILVRHFFSSQESGIYSAASVLGRIIFFISSAILMVAFPLMVRTKTKVRRLKSNLLKAVAFVIGLCSLGILIYSLLPGVVVNFLYSENYRSAAVILPVFAVFISLYSLFNLLIHFWLALEKWLAVWFSGLAAIAQIALIVFSHQSLLGVIRISILVLILALLIMVIPVVKFWYGEED